MNLTVRPFESAHEYRGMIDYFLGGGEDFLRGMGVNPAALPSHEDWLLACLADHDRPDPAKDRLYLAWLLNDEQVGHSSISHIRPGKIAHVHLHLWRAKLRGGGLGLRFLARSLDLYFERFELESIASEPFADNPAPNKALDKMGFRFVRRYRTVPSSIAVEQDVNRWQITRTEWLSRNRGP